jgi:two-component system NtrC family response regulator
MPPLRERRDDIPLLVNYFLNKFNKEREVSMDPDALAVLASYGWPGNVRELENVIERATVLRRGDVITRAELPDKLLKEKRGVEDIILNFPDEGISLEDLERNLIVKALDRYKGNQTRAAEYLHITRPTLIYRMEKYGLK